MNIIIIPGSFKPPHKGHLSIIKKLLKKKSTYKIIIIISNKQRPLNENFLYLENQSKEKLQKNLINYFPKFTNKIMSFNKKELIKYIKELIINNKLPSINAYQSLYIWKIYIQYLKNKYKNKNFPKIELKIALNKNIILETNKVILNSFKEKPSKIILVKSLKNKLNKRFDFLEKKYKKYILTSIFSNIKNVNATTMRKYILENNKKKFLYFLPNDLEKKYKNKIWKYLKKTNKYIL
jgi:cytidyltransferase-like protein